MNTLDVTAPAEQTEGTRSQLLRWLRAVGDAVTENEPLAEIETDKVTVEVASPGTGVLSEIFKHEQEELAPGELLGRIAIAGPADAAARAAPGRVAPAAQAAAARPVSAPPATPAAPAAAHPVSPAVRRLLDQHGLDAAAVAGSGPAGRLTVEDVLRAAGLDPDAPAAQLPPTGRRAGVRPVPHTAVRKRIAEHMVHSLLHTAPHVTTVFEADLGAVLADRERRRGEFTHAGVPLTLTAYFVRAAVAAIRAVPEANSQWTERALEIHEDIHIGVGTAVEGVGLVVPVLRNVQALDLAGIARGLDDLTGRARAGRLAPADVRGGTFTLSNHGVSGSLLAAPIIINQPQAAILGIGKLERRAVVVGEGAQEQIVVRPRCYVTLTLDHRVMDGHQANRFMQVFTQDLAQV